MAYNPSTINTNTNSNATQCSMRALSVVEQITSQTGRRVIVFALGVVSCWNLESLTQGGKLKNLGTGTGTGMGTAMKMGMDHPKE